MTDEEYLELSKARSAAHEAGHYVVARRVGLFPNASIWLENNAQPPYWIGRNQTCCHRPHKTDWRLLKEGRKKAGRVVVRHPSDHHQRMIGVAGAIAEGMTEGIDWEEAISWYYDMMSDTDWSSCGGEPTCKEGWKRLYRAAGAVWKLLCEEGPLHSEWKKVTNILIRDENTHSLERGDGDDNINIP
jgi:hypothetical protein